MQKSAEGILRCGTDASPKARTVRSGYYDFRLMSDMQQKRQLELPFSDAKGEARNTGDRAESLMVNETSEHPAGTERLMEQVANEGNLLRAMDHVVSNKGKPGIDGMTVYDLEYWMKENIADLSETLLQGKYTPQPVRRVEISKPDGGKRKLGIPTVVDRVVQQALLQKLQPIFDPTFSEHSHGFRPNHSAHNAVSEAQSFVQAGREWVVDIDLEKFFDRVNHDMLMVRVARKVKDKRVPRLIRAYLNAGVLEDGLVHPTTEGTPQGGPLSPLLSNIFLDDLDKELERRGHRFVRYADDCNIYVRTEKAAQRVLANVTRFIERKLKLKVNKEKSAAGKPSERKFLGFTIRDDGRRQISAQSMKRYRQRIKEIARWKFGSLKAIIEHLRPILIGWRGYYRFTEIPGQLTDLEGWTRRRLRHLVWRHWKTTKRRFKELVRRGVNPRQARPVAGSSKGPWSLSTNGAIHKALPNKLFERLGFPPLCVQ